eukprot:CAMPEP_0183389328 /NCGR_PEP_ID=MMETSP0370-20130417/4863_1 /TAXON_ID=268820 /ORGANISM="Peridinium aciculiferum, Strain PAER-2" /LENGTH=52 /DNA_ID=CAMNT_0025568561 /DNA_START=724 /DNA_END=880 /DNA_ORIENTATION=+
MALGDIALPASDPSVPDVEIALGRMCLRMPTEHLHRTTAVRRLPATALADRR